MLEFVQGDIFDIPADIRVNTVNCVGVMGAGVALAFKQRYPEMFRDYQRDCKRGEVRPGRMHIWKSLAGDWVINFPTKRDWREPSRYDDIDSGLDDLRSYLDAVGPVTVGLPALGCGNGGLDWSRVSEMIREKLDGVKAHVLVFEPGASIRAGKQSAAATDDERKSAENLGYRLMDLRGLSTTAPSESGFILGREESLSRNWIALLPSRTPGEREMQALQAIAVEVSRSEAEVTIALVHGTKISEEIADLFVRQGVDTVLLLPFGVLTRKALAKSVVSGKSKSLTIASAAPANAKWSRQIFAQTMDMLRVNASAVLLSDPEPDWLTSKGLDKWRQKAISFVRYEATPSSMREALGNAGAKPIGRRDGAPNVEYLLGSFRSLSQDKEDVSYPATVNPVAQLSTPDSKRDSRTIPEDDGEILAVTLDQYTDEQKRALFEEMRKINLPRVTVMLRLPREAGADDRRHLTKLGFRAQPVIK